MPTITGKPFSLSLQFLLVTLFLKLALSQTSTTTSGLTYPTCASSCIGQVVGPDTFTYCANGLADLECTCSDPTDTASMYSCFNQSCTSTDLQQADAYMSSVCNQASISLYGSDYASTATTTNTSRIRTTRTDAITSTTPPSSISATATSSTSASVSSSPASTGSSNSVPIVTIVAVVASVLAVVLIGMLVFFLCRRRSSRTERSNNKKNRRSSFGLAGDAGKGRLSRKGSGYEGLKDENGRKESWNEMEVKSQVHGAGRAGEDSLTTQTSGIQGVDSRSSIRKRNSISISQIPNTGPYVDSPVIPVYKSPPPIYSSSSHTNLDIQGDSSTQSHLRYPPHTPHQDHHAASHLSVNPHDQRSESTVINVHRTGEASHFEDSLGQHYTKPDEVNEEPQIVEGGPSSHSKPDEMELDDDQRKWRRGTMNYNGTVEGQAGQS